MPGSPLRVLHLYPKGDFVERVVEAHFSLRAELDATEALCRRLVDMRGAA